MLNQVVLVGRLTQDLKDELVNEKKDYSITIAIPRSYKNENGEYDTDFIPIILQNTCGKTVCEYCKKGDILGIKGRTESYKENDTYKVRITAKKVTFLSSKKELLNQN